ncbi:PAS domain-containing protein [Microvirga solisilvae]|uniref:PAS domain-containing protein n=1 Tax=Microvirga solisilvae TaxID=2919498 RepID=UPI001FB046E5|nr:PAS domain-containing protein [Microvirga solisilvae]
MTNAAGATTLRGSDLSQPADDNLISDTALFLSNGKLRMALDIGRLGAWEQDLTTGEIIGNEAFKAMFGLSLDTSLTRDTLKGMIHPNDVERVEQAIAFSLRTKTDFQVEHRVLRADGRIGSVHVRGCALYDRSNKPVRLLGVTQDIAEREKAKEESRRVQHRQEFLSRLNEQIGSLDDPYAIMEASARSLAQFLKIDNAGYGEIFEDRDLVVVEREWSKGLFSNDGRIERISEIGEPVFGPLRQGQAIFTEDVLNDPWVRDDPEKVALYKSANVRTILTAPLLKNGKLVSVYYVSSGQVRPWPVDDISLVQDVADRTWMAVEKARAQIRAREAEERLQKATNSFPAIIWTIDADLRLTYVSEGWNTFLGRPLDQASMSEWKALVHPDDLTDALKIEAFHRQRRSSITAEIRCRSNDGTYRWHLVRAVPHIDEHGAFKGWHGTTLDIHDYKLAKEDDGRVLGLRQTG